MKRKISVVIVKVAEESSTPAKVGHPMRAATRGCSSNGRAVGAREGRDGAAVAVAAT